MTRKTAADFDPEVLKLFDQYVHGGISRRDFLSSATRYAVGGTTAAGLLTALSPSFAAPLVAPDDQRLNARFVEILRLKAMARCAAIWWRRKTPRASCRWCWWCTRTAA
jgi:hypothetical protein